MEYRTPTGIAQQKGMPAKQLGSLESVLEAMNCKGSLIVAGSAAQYEALEILPRLTARPDPRSLHFIYATSGPDPLYALHPDTVIGVAPDAFRFVSMVMWADMQRIITKRFKTVHWG
jgi:hypothetical protein